MTTWPELLAQCPQDEAQAIRRGLARHVRRIIAAAQVFLSGSHDPAELDADLEHFDQDRFTVFVDVLGDLNAPIAAFLRNATEAHHATLANGLRGLIRAGMAFLDAKPAPRSGRVVFTPPIEGDDGAR